MLNITPYHAKYFAYELTKRSSSNSIEKLAASLLDAQVDLNPHQVEAALFAFSSPLSKGAILADEVGLGKTIEAGMIISQKWAERKRKILIIVPSNLRKQWNQELLDKFFIPALLLETASFNQEIKKGKLNPLVQDEIVICSYHFARAKEPYISQIDWDLVVIDEAHRLRNVYKPTNKIANAIKRAVAHAPKILLTATPLQNSLLELYGLVSIIDDYTFGDLKSYKNQFTRITGEDIFYDLKERLKPVCKRTLRRQVLEYIKFTNRTAITQEFFPTPEEQQLYDLVSSYLQRDKLYALPSSQRSLMTLILRKLLASSTFAIAGTLEGLAYKLENELIRNNQQEEIKTTLSEDYETYEEIDDEWHDEEKNGEESLDAEERQYTAEEIKEIEEEIRDLREFHKLARSIMRNAKGGVLLTALKNGFAEAEWLGANRKALIFTESRRTQIYLQEILEKSEYAGKIVLFNGTNADPGSREIYQNWLTKNQDTDRITGSKTADQRAAIVDYFKDEAIIMIATEAAAEGLNLQFCSLVANYDLPWNPQRIEQRIGRCHRYGQKYDVVVVNFLNKKNAADQRVYELLSEKFQLFSGVFGASDEVLGSIESGVDFEKRIARIYQNCRTPEEIQSAFDQLQAELDDQIEDRLKTTRQKLLESFDEEVHEKLRVNLRESHEYLNKYENWLWQITRLYLDSYARFNGGEHSFTLIKNPFPNETIHPGPYRIGKNIEDANIYRVGHPLAQRIIDRCKTKELPDTELAFQYFDASAKISVIEPLIDRSGWLRAVNMTVTSFETEDYVMLAGICDDGTVLDEEQCRRLFSLPATLSPLEKRDSLNKPEEQLEEINFAEEATILRTIAERNADFFDTEIEKLDKWAEDIKNSLEIKLKDLDKDIKLRKTESKKILKLEGKVKAQREIKELERKRNEMRMNLYQAQDDVEDKKEKLLDDVEARLQQNIKKEELFFTKWKVI